MLNKLIAWSLENRFAVNLLALLIIIGSGFCLSRMPVEVFPELNAPTVTIMTEAPGYASEEVEKIITFQIETALNGISELRRLRSSSTIGLSIIWAEFDFGTDIYRNRQQIAERLAQLSDNLPKNVHPPQMTPMTSIAGEIMLLALSSPDESVSPLELRKIAEFDLRPRILSAGGVSQVNAIGGEMPEYQVMVDPIKLSQYNLTYDTVVQAASHSHAIMGGGYLPNFRGRELAVRPLTGAHSVEDLALTVVDNTKENPLLLRDVADIQIGGAPKRGTGSTDGKHAVILTIQRNPNINTLEVTKKIDEILDDFEEAIPEGVTLNRYIFRQADFISLAVANLVHALRDGIVFVVIVLILFLMNFRTTVITLMALPLSLGAGIILLDMFGESLNVMTLGGLAVAIGSLVDDAIVDVENFFRRSKENQSLPVGERRSTFEIAYESSIEIRPAILLATFIIVLVFAPLFFLSGIEGKFFKPLGMAYILSLLASLVVAMTVTPVMCYLFFRNEASFGEEKDSNFAGWLKRKYRRSLEEVLKRPKRILKFSAALLGVAFLLGSTFGSSFLPEFNEGSITLFINTPVGTSLEESNRVAKQVEVQASKLPGVRAATRRTGRAEKDEHAEPVSASEIDLRLSPEADVHEVRASLVDLLSRNPGITAQIGGPMAHRLSHILSGTPAAIAIKIFNDDLNELRAIAKKIEKELKPMAGVRDLVANREAMVKTIPIAFDRQKLALHGFTPAEVARQVETALLGTVVGVINYEGSALDIVVRLQESARGTLDDIERLELQSARGARVTVGELSKVYEESSSMLITRENTKRKAVVSCNVGEGHNLGDLIKGVRGVVDPIIKGYPGTYVEYGGQFEAQESASRRIFWISLLVLGVIVGTLYQSFQSMKMAMLILLNLPLALVGGIVALFISDSPSVVGNFFALFGIGEYLPPVVSISALVGFIGLSGIACRNGLLLVSHYQHLEREGCGAKEVLLRGSEERIVPILMTALSSGLALIPIVIAKGQIGSELQYPIALVILGGLATSTFLNLYVIPAAYSLVGGKK